MSDPDLGFGEPASYLTLPMGDDRLVEVVPLTFGRARITVTDGWSVFDSW